MPDLPANVHKLIQLALEEDLGSGDITTEALIDDRKGQASILAKEACVVCGLEVAGAVYETLDPSIHFVSRAEEGSEVEGGSCLANFEGPLASLLKGERTVLNFLQRMCGVASLSRRFVQKAADRVIVLDSRKTIPGWRWLDKLAVRTGGCTNHRMGLYDGILIKDNHISVCGGIIEAVEMVRADAPPNMTIEVEVESLDGLREALEAGVDIVMLDNFLPQQIEDAIQIAGGKVNLEVSGGITLENLEDYIQYEGVDFISTGYMTHSALSSDISMEILCPLRG